MTAFSPEKHYDPGSAVRSTPPGPTSKPDSDAASETSSVNSAASSERKDMDILTQVLAMKTEEYRLLFRLPHDEVLISDFNCALQENILLQGHMYLFVHHICFYSNILGFETKKVIHFREVTCVRKAKTVAIFPNAIEIVVGGKKHFFGSFLSRDEAYRLIVESWTQHNNDINECQENQDAKSEAGSPDNIIVISRKSKILVDDSSPPIRSEAANTLEEPKISLDGEDDGSMTINHTEIKENENEENPMHASLQSVPTWTVEDVVAPKVPEYFTLIAESNFPVHVEDFFKLLLSDQSAGFLEDFHNKCGDKGFHCSPWRPHEQFGNVRDVSFQHPVKVFLGAKFGNCREVQKFRVYKNCHLMVETSQQVSDVPFADYFQVEGIWDVVQDNNEETSCTLRMYSNVAFSKRTIFKGKIEQSTREEVQEVYALWISMAYQLLKLKRVQQSKVGEVKQSRPIVQADGEMDPDKPKTCLGSVENLLPTCSPIENQRNIHDSGSSRSELLHAGQDTSGCFMTLASMLNTSWRTFLSSTKAHNLSALLLIMAFFSIIILMQVCIMLLLTKVPEVRVVPLGDYVRGGDIYRMESVEWLRKRMNHLEEEMVMIETRMEKMHQEYAFLNSYLRKIEEMMNAKS